MKTETKTIFDDHTNVIHKTRKTTRNPLVGKFPAQTGNVIAHFLQRPGAHIVRIAESQGPITAHILIWHVNWACRGGKSGFEHSAAPKENKIELNNEKKRKEKKRK